MLLGIDVKLNRISRSCCVLGWVEAYIGMVEVQNQGTLHLHMILWLQNNPSAEELHMKLLSVEFQETMRMYIEASIHAHLPGMDKQGIKVMERDKDIGFCQPPHPNDLNFGASFNMLEHHLMRSNQIHTCKKFQCLCQNWRTGDWTCKHKAPFTLSETDRVEESGAWYLWICQQL